MPGRSSKTRFVSENIDLRLGDCLEVLPTLPDKSVDAIITDLPYGTTACSWDTVIPFEPMWAQVKRLLKPRGVFVTTASQPFTSALVMSNPKWFRCEWIWRKNEGSCFASSKTMPIRYHESIIVFYDKCGTYNPQRIARWSEQSRKVYRNPVGSGKAARAHGTLKNIGAIKYDSETKGPETVIEIKCVPNGGGGKEHPTQKPVALYEYLIRTYTNEGDMVLDFCAGSGTTGVAAIKTGRNCILIEKETKYYEIAKQRIQGVIRERGKEKAYAGE